MLRIRQSVTDQVYEIKHFVIIEGKIMTKRKRKINPVQQPKPITSLLDKMEDGVEFESLLRYKAVNVDLASEIRRSLKEISNIRECPTICYVSNIVNSNIQRPISINYNDDLPFCEMINAIDGSHKKVDIIVVTPGGSGQQVAKFVDKLRPRFDNVSFILPNMAMSSGTIFAMSGDEIIMGPNSYIGPIDPQVLNRDGMYVPAQAILTLIEDIKNRGKELLKIGQNPPWTDLQILKQIDAKEIGNAINASQYSIELVKEFLYKYKFKSWTKHSSSGENVTDKEKQERAKDIASYLCDHSQWLSHSRGITREAAWEECKIKITHSESIENLDRAIRRFWALMYWIFENTAMAKLFISDNYCIFRQDVMKKGR